MKKFKPRPGQVDFTNIRWAPVINCVLRYKNKVLLVQRNKEMNLYPGRWSGISGFLDDDKTLKEKTFEELRKETGISKKDIVSFKQGQIFDQEGKKYKKTWIIHPILVQVNTDKVALDWEAKKYVWVSLDKIKNYKLLPGFDMVIRALFS